MLKEKYEILFNKDREPGKFVWLNPDDGRLQFLFWDLEVEGVLAMKEYRDPFEILKDHSFFPPVVRGHTVHILVRDYTDETLKTAMNYMLGCETKNIEIR